MNLTISAKPTISSQPKPGVQRTEQRKKLTELSQILKTESNFGIIKFWSDIRSIKNITKTLIGGKTVGNVECKQYGKS